MTTEDVVKIIDRERPKEGCIDTLAFLFLFFCAFRMWLRIESLERFATTLQLKELAATAWRICHF